MRYFFLLASVFLLFACGTAPKSETMYEALYESEDYNSIGNTLGGGVLMAKSAPAAVSRSRGSIEAVAAEGWMDSQSEMIAAEPAPSKARMVNYTGNIYLQSAEPEAVINTVVQMAKAKGGSIDNRRNGFVSLQIPVAEFNNFFNYILTLGLVTNKSIFANDITEAYADNAARLRIAESTLARLQQLLAAAKTEQEKLALLKEIQRVSEQIEQAKLTEKELLRKAAFSTITLWVYNTPQQPIPLKQNIKAFKWFQELVSTTHSNKDKALELQVPKDFIEIKGNKHRWSTASALNATFQAFKKENEPQGTPDFWANAMLEFFKFQYGAELKSEENFSMIRLQSYHIEPEIYYIAILKQSNKKTLKIAVAKFPNSEVEQKNSEAVKEVLRRAKK
jgi:TfoX/Sxy family transcriptional regulator of competence genes